MIQTWHQKILEDRSGYRIAPEAWAFCSISLNTQPKTNILQMETS